MILSLRDVDFLCRFGVVEEECLLICVSSDGLYEGFIFFEFGVVEFWVFVFVNVGVIFIVGE